MKLNAAWLSAPEIKTLTAAFENAGFELRFVGGCVRDTILERPFTEIDAATNALPEQTTELLEKSGLRAIPTGIQHGTVTALVNGKTYEITTLRKDVSTDGRHAEVAFTDQWEEDAKRRDFTMNALYLSPDGSLHDYVNGYEDCLDAHVLFIGDATARIREDYLRILRYFRFVAILGGNRFNAEILSACKAEKAGIRQLSGERILTEILKLLAADDASGAIAAMQAAGILELILPSHENDVEAISLLDAMQANALVKLAALIGESGQLKPIAERLKLSNKQQKSIECWLTHAANISPRMDALSQKKLVRKLGAEDYVHTLQLACALSGGEWGDYALLAEMSGWQAPDFPIDSAELMAMGYEGKALGEALRALEEEWENSDYSLSKEQLLTLQPRLP